MPSDGPRGPTTPTSSWGTGPFSGDVPPELASSICQYVREALGRFGASGEVHLDGDGFELVSAASSARAPAAAWILRWPELDENTRRHRALEVARQLAQPRALAAARRSSNQGFLTAIVAGLALCTAGLAAYFFLSGAPVDAAPTQPVSHLSARELDANRERDARDQRVCEATRVRVLRGATVGVTETDGWVVEFYGFSAEAQAPFAKNPALAKFVAHPESAEGSDFIWADEPHLATVVDSATKVTVTDETISGSAGTVVPALRLTFQGNFVDPYFDPEQRARFYHIAHGLSGALGLTHAGLYARCAAGRTHHLGSWFRGPTDAAAASALLYLLGTYAEPPHLGDAFLHAPGQTALDRSVALGNIERATGPVDRALLASVLGRQGGMITGKSGQGVIIAFPFRDGNRASRASRELARLVQLNTDGP